AVGIARHLHGAIGAEVLSLIGLHSTLLGLLCFARNDGSTGSEFRRIGVPLPRCNYPAYPQIAHSYRSHDRQRSDPARRRPANLPRALDAERPSTFARRQFFRTAEVPPFVGLFWIWADGDLHGGACAHEQS